MSDGTAETRLAAPEVAAVDLGLGVEVHTLPKFQRPLQVSVRDAKLLLDAPWVRSLGKMGLEVTTQGWRFPQPCEPPTGMKLRLYQPEELPSAPLTPAPLPPLEGEGLKAGNLKKEPTRLRPPSDTVIFKDRLLY